MSKAKLFCLAVLCVAMLTACGEVGGGGDDGTSSGGFKQSSSSSNPSSSSFNANGACYADYLGTGMCITYENGHPITRDFCKEVSTLLNNDGYELELEYRDSCPPDHIRRCESEESELVAYYYGSVITPNITCKMLLEGE